MHRLLKHQLRRLRIDPEKGPEQVEQWTALLGRVASAYDEADQDRYTLERSLDVSSREMHELYDALRASSDSQLATERDRLKAVIASVGDGLCLLDADHRVLLANPECLRLLRVDEAELLGENFPTFVGVDCAEGLLHRTLPDSGPYRVEDAFFNRKDGGSLPVSFVVNPVSSAGERPGSVVVFRDTTLQRQNEQALRAARDSAQKANQAKSEFLSRMSHELRTPMNSILGFAQLLELDDESPLSVDQRDSLDHILRGGRHLLELINEVLDLARIESGRLEVSLEAIDTGPLLDECLDLIRPLANERAIEVAPLPASLEGLSVRGDYTRLKQVFINLLSNAVKYNRRGGRVSVLVAAGAAGHRRIGIADTGPGISENQIAAIFEPFGRLASNEEVEGTGIGLTITRRLMDLMGGSVEVESEVGKGSVFWVELVGEALRDTDELDETPVQIDATPEHQDTVLYIEDNPANLQLVKIILRRRPGIRLISAERAEPGIELAKTHQPSLILMDINLPGIDGFGALAAIREVQSLSHIPVIAVSANAMPRDIQRAEEAGFDGYLTKPLDVNLFLTTVDETLARIAGTA